MKKIAQYGLTLTVCFAFFAAAISAENKKANVFTIKNPDYEQSPNTGMTRQHWKDAALYLLNGAFSYIHSKDDPMKFPKLPGKSYPRNDGQIPTEKLEGLCRTLFVAAPLLKEDSNLVVNGIRVADYYRYQIGKLIDPTSESYIKPRGKNGGPSQNLVEYGALAISMTAVPEVLWNPLTKTQKDALAASMLSYGDGPTVPSNWKFFNIFVLSFFKDKGYAVNEKLLEEYLQKSLDHYRGDGWYNDNPAYDYYSMWAFQMYGVFWADYYGKKYYPEYAQKFMNNFRPVKENYPYMFSRKGEMIMWGRSISYRFGAVAPMMFTGFERDPNTNYGWMRHIASNTLLQFLQNPEFLKDNVPTLGFYGPFEPAVQGYSCRGSVYWSGKAFLGLFLPEDNPFWSATENEGPWANGELNAGNVYNKFQTGSNLLLTDYPNIGASEIRSWCNVPVIGAGEPFRGSENYNRLAYNSAFPWQADGEKGEVSMNYVVKNRAKQWEPLRMFTFRKFENGIYYRDAVLETNKNIQFRLADIPLANGILRVDELEAADSAAIRLGHYSLPETGTPISETTRKVKGHTVKIIDNGVYQLATVSIAGWKGTEAVHCSGLHPVSQKSAVIDLFDECNTPPTTAKTYITLLLWKKSGEKWSKDELYPFKKITHKKGSHQTTVVLLSGETKEIEFK